MPNKQARFGTKRGFLGIFSCPLSFIFFYFFDHLIQDMIKLLSSSGLFSLPQSKPKGALKTSPKQLKPKWFVCLQLCWITSGICWWAFHLLHMYGFHWAPWMTPVRQVLQWHGKSQVSTCSNRCWHLSYPPTRLVWTHTQQCWSTGEFIVRCSSAYGSHTEGKTLKNN